MTFLYILSNVIFVIGVILFAKSKIIQNSWWKIPANERERKGDQSLLMWMVGLFFILASILANIIWSMMGVDEKFFPIICLARWLGRTLYGFILNVKDDPVRIVGLIFIAFILVFLILVIGAIKEEKQKRKRRQEEEERRRYW